MGKKKKLILIGGGGHAKVVIDAVREGGEFEICGIVDPAHPKGASISGINVLGPDDILAKLFDQGIRDAFISVGSIDSKSIASRKRIYDTLKRVGFKLPCIIHPAAILAKDRVLGEGTFVAAAAVINPHVKIGKNVIVNTRSSIDHDCVIGDFAHIAPGAILSGGVKLACDVHIGANATIRQNVRIGEGSLIAAGETVRSDVGKRVKYVSPLTIRRNIQIIAEAGVNHNGSIKTAKKMIDKAKEAGADFIKFQTFRSESIVSKRAPKALYQKKHGRQDESQLDMLKRLELNKDAHRELVSYCRRKRIKFLSSPFDLESAELLNDLGLDIFKIPSGEITNRPLLEKVGSLGKKVIISTGMSSLREVKEALNILANAGTRRDEITVLHCNTEYPTPYKDVNLAAMVSMKERLEIAVGYSDHTPGIEVSIAAAALGADIIEKHFTLDKNMNGPDHKASLNAGELREMVRAIRNIEEISGDGKKRATPSELRNREIVRKSIVAARGIQKGELFTEENITTKRPAKGISPMEWNNLIGKGAKKAFKKDELIAL